MQYTIQHTKQQISGYHPPEPEISEKAEDFLDDSQTTRSKETSEDFLEQPGDRSALYRETE